MIRVIEVEWEAVPAEVLVPENTICVFKLNAEGYYGKIAAEYGGVLSEDELARSRRYLREADKNRFVAGRHFLRSILSNLTGTPPSNILFYYTPKKKPSVIGFEFNLSHSGNYVLMAIARMPLGIDVEFVNSDFDYQPVLNFNFSGAEASFIKAGLNNASNFYLLWTRKEALLKATGEGLADRLDEIPGLDSEIARGGQTYKVISFIVDEWHVASMAFCAANNLSIHFYG